MAKEILITLIIATLSQLTLTLNEEITANIDIKTINNNNGYSILKTKDRLFIESYTKILHILNISEYIQTTETIRKAIDSKELNKNDPILMLIKNEYEDLIHNLKTLTPLRRQKRGLLNFGGKIFKYIIGTMDDDDAQEIYSHLNNLDTNTKNLVDEENKQVIINNNLITSVNKIKEHIDKQTNEIEKYLYNIGNITDKMTRREDDLQQMFTLYITIERINKALVKFSDIILLSKLNLLAHDIFSNEELIKFNLTMETRSLIKSNIIFLDKLIIFVINIPKFTNKKFYEAIIIPFPNKNKEELDIDITNVIIQNKTIYKHTEETIKQNQLKLIKQDCIGNVLKQNNSCNYIINSQSSISQLENNMIITKNFPITEIKQSCNENPYFIAGNNIIIFHLCQVEINNSHFDNEHSIYFNTYVMQNFDINITKTINNLTLETLSLETIENRKMIKHIEFNKNNNNNNLIYTVLMIFIIICIILSFILIKSNKRDIVTKVELRTHNDNIPDPFK